MTLRRLTARHDARGQSRIAVAIASVLLVTTVASSDAGAARRRRESTPPPYPRARPAPPPAEKRSEPAARPVPAVSACVTNLRTGIAIIQPLAPMAGPGECGIADPVKLEAIWSRSGRKIVLKPAVTLGCEMAAALSGWVRDDLSVKVLQTKSQLAAIVTDAAYECRGRNRVIGAKISQHGFGAALDLRAFELADGVQISLTDPKADKALRSRVQASTCARFGTVLGPGSDGYHESHIHLDIIQRRHGTRICQWDVK